MRRLLPVLVAALFVALTASAQAAPITIKKSIWGPVTAFDTYADLGVGLYQTALRWDEIAAEKPGDPANYNDPAYKWPEAIDRAIAEGQARGIEVSLLVMGTPRWANGDREWRWAPNDPQDYAAFIAAASRRYPAVRHWMVWGEPTKASNWQPLRRDRGRPLKGKGLNGPRKYAQLLDASYAALKGVTKANRVIGGNTFTVGTVAPLRWVKALKLPDGRRPRMDLWGHNPFSARKPRLKDVPLGNGYADFSDLDELARALDRSFPDGLKLFLSEYSLPTDHRNFEFNFYVRQSTQAKWLTAALRITRSYSRIYTFGYLGLYDDEPRPDGDQVDRGLLTYEGERKPAYAAFRDN